MRKYGKRVNEILGAGAFGEVYKMDSPSDADFCTLYPLVAVKKIKHPKRNSRDEVDILKDLQHKSIVKYLTSFRGRGGSLCIVMEYCDHGTLTSAVREMYTQEYAVWRFLCQMANALQYLHNQRPPIIHRDLKPDNILGKKDPRNGSIQWKIADFGIARVLRKNCLGEYYASSVCGTPVYMAPEVLRGRPYSTPADLWSLGAIISFRCNRRHLFDSLGSVEHWTGRRSSLDRTRYSFGFRRLLRYLLCPTPSLRPTAGEVLQECRKDCRQYPRSQSI